MEAGSDFEELVKMDVDLRSLEKGLKKMRIERLDNYLWILLGQGIRFLINSIYFIILVRVLDVNEYGLVSSTLSIMYIVFPFVGFGIGNILIRNIAQNKEKINEIWGQSIIITILSFLLFVPITLTVYLYINRNDINAIVFVVLCITELLFYSLIELCCQLFQVINKSKLIAKINIVFSILRLGSVLILFVFPAPDVNDWLSIYFISSLISTIFALYLVTRNIGFPKIKNYSNIFSNLKEGSFFSINNGVTAVINELDKVILSTYFNKSVVGLYALGYKVIDLSFIPIKSYLFYSYSNFFKFGDKNLKGILKFAIKKMKVNIYYASLLAFFLYFMAPYAEMVIGKEGLGVEKIIRYMCLIPIIRTVYYFLGDALTGAGYQKVRTFINLIVSILGVIMNIILIQRYSLLGAILTMYFSYLLITIIQFISILILLKRESAIGSYS
ncbi:oligosaccharide flippase family protein [Geobacillus stearothermophilus]|nr:oligosaccharide flippase family protein [Geobacillus stearothermophilus]